MIYFAGEILPNLDLKNTISTYTLDFLWTNWLKLSDFNGFFLPKLPEFYDGFQ